MQTSYFNGIKNRPDLENRLVSIAGGSPDWYTGKQYKKLAPKYAWWKEWHDKKLSNEWYIRCYQETILERLDPLTTYRDLGEDAILLCHEVPGQFCHRRLVANWFLEKLSIKIPEMRFQAGRFIQKEMDF